MLENDAGWEKTYKQWPEWSVCMTVNWAWEIVRRGFTEAEDKRERNSETGVLARPGKLISVFRKIKRLMLV